jgi:N-acetylmuramic acid 6-phosphate (MurNAc-6-P) etherase
MGTQLLDVQTRNSELQEENARIVQHNTEVLEENARIVQCNTVLQTRNADLEAQVVSDGVNHTTFSLSISLYSSLPSMIVLL